VDVAVTHDNDEEFTQEVVSALMSGGDPMALMNAPYGADAGASSSSSTRTHPHRSRHRADLAVETRRHPRHGPGPAGRPGPRPTGRARPA
jgi:hypothetical protein